MRIILSLLIVVSLHVATALAQDPRPKRVIDVNARGALATLQHSSPADYAKIQGILVGLSERPAPDVPRWIQTNFAAQEVGYSPILLTSYPPQRSLEFVLNDTRYRAVVTLRPMRAEIVPTN